MICPLCNNYMRVGAERYMRICNGCGSRITFNERGGMVRMDIKAGLYHVKPTLSSIVYRGYKTTNN
jgi:hypothetical protein